MQNYIESYYVELPYSLKDNIISICKNSEYAIYIFYLTAYLNLYYIFFFKKDIQIGIHSMNLDIYSFNHNINRNTNFATLLNIIKQQIIETIKNEEPLDKNSKNNLDFLFLFNANNEENFSILNKLMIEVDSKYNLKILYSSSFYSKSAIEKIGQYFIDFLNKIINSPKINLSEINIIDDEDQSFLEKYSIGKTVEYENTTIQELFKSRVKCIPDHIALEYLDQKMSYRELDVRSDYLAGVLLKNGAKENTIIGLLTERSPKMVVGVLGIIKSGAGYLPLNLKNPLERNLFILRDANVSILIKDKNVDIKGFEGIVIEIDSNMECAEQELSLPAIDTSGLAYVIYTSGSTGTPKGIMIEHNSVINMLSTTKEKDKGFENTAYLLMTNYCFDVSVMELFGWFYSYSKLVILPEGLENNMKAIVEVVISKKVTHISMVPSVLEVFKKYLQTKNIEIPTTLKVITAGGECISYKLVKELKEILNDTKVINIYGPSEATVYVSYYEADLNDQEANVPMGKPIQNTQFYVLGEEKEILPIGAIGELYISGKCLSRGYLNLDQTKARFINYDGRLVYHTGDIVKWSEKGYLMFLHRNDNQVKINGNRIELEEIERSILKFSKLIEEVSVLAIDDIDNNKRLSCFYVSKDNIIIVDLVKYLEKILPKYMIPLKFIKIDSMPINNNGKRDIRKLATLINNDSQQEQTIFTDNKALALANIWKDVLGVYPSSWQDDFFKCGGDSLKAISASIAISQIFSMDFSVKEIFNNSEFGEIYKLISNGNINTHELGNDNLVFMRKGTTEGNLFLIHEVSGGIGGYIQLANYLDEKYNCWGIQFPDDDSRLPKNINIRELAKEYIKSIKLIQKTGPYNILGWSAGGSIAMAIAEELEFEKETINLLVIVDTYINITESYNRAFSRNQEIEFLNKFVPSLSNYNIPNRTNEIIELYENVTNNVPSDIVTVVPETLEILVNSIYSNFDEFTITKKLQKINRMRTILNTCNCFRSKIKSDIYYFKANDSGAFEKDEWENICQGKLTIFNINGDHFSIFKEPRVKELGRIINSYL